MILAAIDTGCRIEELLTLKRVNVDFDSLVMKVSGKGKKERIVPFSIELRRHLYKLLKSHSFELVFCARSDHQLNPDIMRRFSGRNLSHYVRNAPDQAARLSL